jgi:hypothetical protein
VGWACIISTLGAFVPARADSFRIESLGARYGFGANLSSSHFQQAEAFADWDLPWAWDLGREWQLRTLVDSSVGWLADEGADGGIFAIGPGFELARNRFPVSIAGGINPTLLTTVHYSEKYFGTQFQFTSYIGLTVRLGSHLQIGYRFQHMSNAGLGRSNPGLNLNMLMLSYAF